ncbi:MAG: hypothetical protein BHV68_13325 [Bacteroidales bacterium 43_8]|nr:MAG: hypothetical protein BHV68_13325 [Bacteroidales bacterium 43_8]
MSVAPGKIIPGRSAVPPSPAPGRKNHPRRELRYFSVPAPAPRAYESSRGPAPRAYESSRGNRSVRDIKPHNILFIACAIKTIKFVRAENT